MIVSDEANAFSEPPKQDAWLDETFSIINANIVANTNAIAQNNAHLAELMKEVRLLGLDRQTFSSGLPSIGTSPPAPTSAPAPPAALAAPPPPPTAWHSNKRMLKAEDVGRFGSEF